MMAVTVLLLGFRVCSSVHGFSGRGGFVRKLLTLALAPSPMLVEGLGSPKSHVSMVSMASASGFNPPLLFAESLRFFSLCRLLTRQSMHMIGPRIMVKPMMIPTMIPKVEEGDRESSTGTGTFWTVSAGGLVTSGRVSMTAIVTPNWFCGRGKGVLVLTGTVMTCSWFTTWTLPSFCIVISVSTFIEMNFCVVVL